MMAMLRAAPLAIGVTLAMTLATTPASGQQARLPEVDRQTALTHLRAGQDALALERFETAEREFRAAIKLNPRLELAHYGLGQVFMATKSYEQAVDAFVSCRKLFQQNVAETQEEGLLYERRLNDQIQSKREELHALQTGRVRMINPAGSIDRVRNELGQLERLRNRTREPIGGMPPFILTALGSAYFRTGAFADAEREWRAAVAVDPAIGEVHNNLAVVLMLTGRFDEASREIELAEQAGFRVSDTLKEDLRSRATRKH
jgi:tetratricopeptide (TPR) repeat protein